jgi:PmbA protein
MTTKHPNNINLLDTLIQKAKAAGADNVDALFVEGVSNSTSIRQGKLEDLHRSEGKDLGLRVQIGKRQAIVSSSDVRESIIPSLVERAMDMARVAPEDPWCGLADKDRLAHGPFEDLQLFDNHEPSVEDLKKLAGEAEEAAMAVKGVTNSDGGSAGFHQASVALATSDGFQGYYQSSSFSVSVSALASDDNGMERDYDYSSRHFFSDLKSASEVGLSAGTRTVKRLNSRKVESQQVPMVFDPRVSNSLLGHFSGAINGHGVARGSSFLKDMMGEQVFTKGITIVDKPKLIRGPRSKPFDGEGVNTETLFVIEDGMLKSWVLDSASAMQLGLETTGHATRGTSGPPGAGTTNFYMTEGNISPEALIKDIDQGFYITELVGMGVNGVTGDYSRGAVGFWIDKGEIAFPVSEVTIAGNLKDMFKNITPADNLVFDYGTNAPTLRVDGMMLAGA